MFFRAHAHTRGGEIAVVEKMRQYAAAAAEQQVFWIRRTYGAFSHLRVAAKECTALIVLVVRYVYDLLLTYGAAEIGILYPGGRACVCAGGGLFAE